MKKEFVMIQSLLKLEVFVFPDYLECSISHHRRRHLLHLQAVRRSGQNRHIQEAGYDQTILEA